ncbi:MAG: hypothetical protein ACOH2V_13345 [Candidatus Saccharimonadaceae bacterium]
MRISINPFRFIQRLRHAGGFSVHSPFAFDLILDTIHTPHRYYLYQDNLNKINNAGLKKQINVKYAELLFRLVNRFDAKEILEIGTGMGINTLYLSGYSKDVSIVCVEKDDKKTKIAQSLLSDKLNQITFVSKLESIQNKFDVIVWDLALYSQKNDEVFSIIRDSIKTEGFVVVNNINKNKHHKKLWQKIRSNGVLTMSFDLESIGIGFLNPGLPTLNYDVYF